MSRAPPPEREIRPDNKATRQRDKKGGKEWRKEMEERKERNGEKKGKEWRKERK